VNLCLFDLDNTLLSGDSDYEWGQFLVDRGVLARGEYEAQNAAFFEQYKAGTLDIHAYVEAATAPLRARSGAECAALHARFMRDIIAPNLRREALDLVRSHRERGDLLALVTATNDFVTGPIAAAFGIDTLIAVRLERDAEGRPTGRIAGTPSYRSGKVARVEQWLAQRGKSLGDFTRVSVYSDSLNDLALLERATEPVATNPSEGLAALARQRGWRILELFP